MRTKDLVVDREYAYTPKVWGKSYQGPLHYFRVRLLSLHAPVPTNHSLSPMPRHKVLHLDDVTGEPLTHFDGDPRVYYVTPAELVDTWEHHVELLRRPYDTSADQAEPALA